MTAVGVANSRVAADEALAYARDLAAERERRWADPSAPRPPKGSRPPWSEPSAISRSESTRQWLHSSPHDAFPSRSVALRLPFPLSPASPQTTTACTSTRAATTAPFCLRRSLNRSSSALFAGRPSLPYPTRIPLSSSSVTLTALPFSTFSAHSASDRQAKMSSTWWKAMAGTSRP